MFGFEIISVDNTNHSEAKNRKTATKRNTLRCAYDNSTEKKFLNELTQSLHLQTYSTISLSNVNTFGI